jgi:hypothetical protein
MITMPYRRPRPSPQLSLLGGQPLGARREGDDPPRGSSSPTTPRLLDLCYFVTRRASGYAL